MARKTPVVVNVSLTGPEWDHDTRVTFLGRRFRLVRRGTAGDLAAARELVRAWAPKAAAVAVTGVRDVQATGPYAGELRARHRTMAEAGTTPVTDGTQLLEVLQEWSVRRVETEMPGYFTNARVLVLGGRHHDRTTRILREHTANIQYADPLQRLNLPEPARANPVAGLAVDAVNGVTGLALRAVPEGSCRSDPPPAPPPAPWPGGPHATATSSWRRTTSWTASGSRTWPARPSSRRRSPPSGWPTWATGGSTWSST